MEFVPKASKIIEKMISIRLKEEEVQHLDDKKKNAPQKQQYCLARDRTRRHTKSPQSYDYAYLVAYTHLAAYALRVIESFENKEHYTYDEVITSREST